MVAHQGGVEDIEASLDLGGELGQERVPADVLHGIDDHSGVVRGVPGWHHLEHGLHDATHLPLVGGSRPGQVGPEGSRCLLRGVRVEEELTGLRCKNEP